MVRTGFTSAYISLLGVLTVLGEGRKPLPLGVAGPTLELLAYLLVNGRRPVRRDHLADVIWQYLDETRSRAALNTALWRVRQALRKMPGLLLRSDALTVHLDRAPAVIIDTAELRSVTRAAVEAFTRSDGLPEHLRAGLHEVLARPSGEFLEGYTSNWVLVERQDYLNLQIRGLSMLMQDAGLRAVYEDALDYGRRILALDAFREQVHSQMLWLFMMTGRRANAIRHYRDYEALLQDELGIRPMPETRAIYEMICTEDPAPPHLHQAMAAAPRDTMIPDAGHTLDAIASTRRAFYRSHFATGG